MDASPAELVTQLYREILLRDPDPEGLDSNVTALSEGTLSADDLRRALLDSAECQALIQPLVAEIHDLYARLRAREPTPEDLARHVDLFRNGYASMEQALEAVRRGTGREYLRIWPVRAAAILHNIRAWVPADELRTGWVTLENQGASAWEADRVQLLIDVDGRPAGQLSLPRPVPAGDRVTLHWIYRTPREVGRHEFQLAVVEPEATTAPEPASPPLRVPFQVTPEPHNATSQLRDWAVETCLWHWLPGEGISWSGDGPGYPLFARKARGCRITDLEGRSYLDCSMGWGCALLGYANERIRRAVAEALDSAAILTLTHHLAYEVARMLCQIIPTGEMVVFGKNGSDVCTAAARLARVQTGRNKILHCGYHGWQDWWVERYGFAATGVPDRPERLLWTFEFNNLEQAERLFHEHRGQVAAVMLEPAGPLEGHNGPVRDADPAFLNGLAELAHREGALLIFDEIFTGFRYRSSSVQQATGVRPDLTCLGKALSAGMPLAALVGRRDAMQPFLGRINYGPTFMHEVYSLAAAREALTIYQEQDVAAHVWDFGERLREVVNRLCRQYRVPAELMGPPFRMMLVFTDGDEERLLLMRTLFHQEMHRRGVLIYMNLVLPSLAHDEQALADLSRAFEGALQVVAEARRGDRFAAYLELPPIMP